MPLTIENNSKMPSALILIANGTEEIEAVVTIDILRRADFKVTIASVENASFIVCSRFVKIVPDIALSDLSIQEQRNFDILVLPGGLIGAETFQTSDLVQKLLEYYLSDDQKSKRHVGMICAAPIALLPNRLAKNSTITCYPSFKDQMRDAGYILDDAKVVLDGNLITSQGPGTSFVFALQIVETLVSREKREKAATPMLLI